VRIAVLGSAAIAKRSVAPLLVPDLGFELVQVGYRPGSRDKAEAFAEHFGCTAVGLEDVLSNVEALYIPYPPALHEHWVLKAVSMGVHVLCEKPLATSLDSARSMFAAASRAGVVLLENYMFLQHTQHAIAARLLPELGEIRAFRGTFAFPPFSDSNNIRYHRQLGGGALLDTSGYPIQAAMHWLGTALRVESAALQRVDAVDGGQVDVWGDVTLRNMSSGVPAQITFGFDNAYRCGYTLLGSKAIIELPKAYTPRPNQETRVLFHKDGETTAHTVKPDNHFRGILQRFRQLIDAGEGTPLAERQRSLECARIQEEILHHVR
jgi:NDP-hexose-3-ketoreductase